MSVQHDFLDLDEFVAGASPEEERWLAPSQVEGLQKGCWALFMGDEDEITPNAKVGCFYIFADQDFTVISATTGESYAELVAENDEVFNSGKRRGRMYTADAPGGEMSECDAHELIPITEEQANEIRFYEYRLPVILGMVDWFRPLLDSFKTELETSGKAGLTTITCPKCGAEGVALMITHTAQTIYGAGRATDQENTYRLGMVLQRSPVIKDISHAHLVCPGEDCDYNECLDLTQFEIEQV